VSRQSTDSTPPWVFYTRDRYFLFLFVATLVAGSTPWFMFCFERFLHTHDRDPINWDNPAGYNGNHGPWVFGNEEGVIILCIFALLLLMLLTPIKLALDARQKNPKLSQGGFLFVIQAVALFFAFHIAVMTLD
jgi:hypothetical protein